MSSDSPRMPSPSPSDAGSTNDPKHEKMQEPKEEPVLSSYATASSSASSLTLPTPATAKQRLASFWRHFFHADVLMQDINPAHATFLLWCFCFMSGFINAIPFSAILLWCGFQTGNTVQLAMAIGRFLSAEKPDLTFHAADQQALISLLSYLGGGYLGRFGDYMGSNRRTWLMSGTLVQALFTMMAAILIWKSGEPSIADSRGEDAWANTLSSVTLGLISASMGLQGVMARRISSHFGATVVLTTLWSELISDPDLFRVGRANSRDHRLLAVLAFILGAIFSRGLVNQTSSATVFGVATALRVMIAISWLFVPGRK